MSSFSRALQKPIPEVMAEVACWRGSIIKWIKSSLCAVEFLPGGGSIRVIRNLTTVGGIFIGVVDDVYTGQPLYKVVLEFVPLGSCFELLGSLMPIRQVE